MGSQTPNTSLSQSIRLDIPGGDYFLTTLEEGDAEAMQEIIFNDSVGDELINVPKPYTLDNAKFWVSGQLSTTKILLPIPTLPERNTTFFTLNSTIPMQLPLQAIRHNSKLIGSVSLSRASGSPQKVELGYYLSPKYHGKRIMQQASKALIRYGANEWGIRTVFGRVDVENERSGRVIAGLAREAMGREVEISMQVLKFPENKKGGAERETRIWEWTVKPEEGWEFDVEKAAS